MKAKELRIGNWIIANNLHKGKEARVNSINDDVFDENSRVIHFKDLFAGEFIENCEPIPLTDEWKLKLGFEVDILNGFKKDNIIIDGENRVHIIDSSKYGIIIARNIEYVHQLQNLYFALTNQEL